MIKPILLSLSLFLITDAASAQVYVNGYSRSDGSFVNGHYRTSPDSSVYNNRSYSPSFGNSNPSHGSYTDSGMYIPNNGGMSY